MKKFMVTAVCAMLLVFSAQALNLSSMDGDYDVYKVTEKGENYVYESSIQLSQNNERKVSDNSFRYSMKNENRSGYSDISFYQINGREYASVTPPMSTRSLTYRVKENQDFSIELINVDNEEDILRIVFDRSSNDFNYEDYYGNIADESGEDLYYSLYSLINNHKSLGYDNAKVEMFGNVDNDENGDIYCVYTDLVVHSKYPKNEIMNCEHTWPQSKLGSSNFAVKRGDLFHLFPTDSKANSRRSNYPFGWVEKVKWEQDGSKLGWDSKGKLVFEPKDSHKGNVARGMFYMGVRYRMDIDRDQEETFREWNKLDPVDEEEMNRNSLIEDLQKTRNPFIDNPEFIDRITDF